VFDELPDDQRVTNIQDSFVPVARERGEYSRPELKERLREKVLMGWPDEASDFDVKLLFSSRMNDLAMEVMEFESQPGVRLKLFVAGPAREPIEKIEMRVGDESDWKMLTEKYGRLFGSHMGGTTTSNRQLSDGVRAHLDALSEERKAVVLLLPRGIGPHRPKTTDQQFVHWRRRFMLLGQTVDGMRVWDIVRAIELIPHLPRFGSQPLVVHASGDMAMNGLLASILVESEADFDLSELPANWRDAPDYLNIQRVVDFDNLLSMGDSVGHE